MTDTPEHQMLSEDETYAVVKAAIGASGGQSREDLEKVVEWAAKARVNEAMLALVLRGEAGMFVAPDGELTMRSAEHWPVP